MLQGFDQRLVFKGKDYALEMFHRPCGLWASQATQHIVLDDQHMRFAECPAHVVCCINIVCIAADVVL